MNPTEETPRSRFAQTRQQWEGNEEGSSDRAELGRAVCVEESCVKQAV